MKVPRAKIAGLSSAQWALLERICRRAEPLEEAQLQAAVGIDADLAARIILAVSEATGARAKLYWLVFHDDHLAARRRYTKGFQPTPWTCDECERRVLHDRDLRYEMQADLKEPIEFE
jgi:hypothetical protein